MSGTEHDQQLTSSSDSSKQRSGVPRWVRWVLAKWWALLVLLALGLLTNVLLLPLSQGTAQWWPGVQAQVAALIQLPVTQPYLSMLLAAVVPLLSLAGWWADRTLKHQEHVQIIEEIAESAKRASNQQPALIAASSVAENQITIEGQVQGQGIAIGPQASATTTAYEGPVTKYEGPITQHIYQSSPPSSTVTSSQEDALGRKYRYDCYQQISLPPNYLERTDVIAEVRSVLLAHASTVALTSGAKSKPAALHGMGGIGKSVIARALCDDPAVQEAFPDGILWATLGQTPDLLDQQHLWIEALGGRISENAPTTESLKRTLAELLKERACLLILDDVWQHTHADAFRVDAPRCRLLLTTRDAEIARELSAQVQPIPVMTSDDAIKLLEEWADEHLNETAPELKEQIVKRLGYLPLAVKLAGAQLQRKAPGVWLRAFDVRKLTSKRPEDLHDSLEQTFQLSLEALDVLSRQLYLALAIFKEDMATPQVAIEKLWRGLAELDVDATGDLIDDLAARALLELAPHGPSRAARLHDLMRDLISIELGEAGRLAAHQALLGAYSTTWLGNGWHSAPDDSYLYDHLAYHLAEAGAWEELKSLFGDQRWMEVRIPQRGYTYDGYLADLSLIWDHTFANARQQIETNQEPTSLADSLRYTLIRTSINDLASNYSPELVLQALKEGVWTPQRALSIAAKILDPQKRVQMYRMLLESSCLSLVQQKEAQRFGLEAAFAIEYADYRVLALTDLAPLIPEPIRTYLLHQALEVALTLTDDQMKAKALSTLAPQLPESTRTVVLQQALEVAQDRWEEWDQREEFASLAPQLTGAFLQQALEAAFALSEERARAEILCILAPQLTGVLLQKALETVFTFSEARNRVDALGALAPQFPEPDHGNLLQQALEAALALPEARDRADALSTLAKKFSEPARTYIQQQAIEAICAITNTGSRAVALANLAPQLNDIFQQQALNTALSISEEGYRVRTLCALAPRLAGTLLQQALEAAHALSREHSRAIVLRTLAPRFPEPTRTIVLQQALEAALASEESQIDVLSALAPQLTGALLQQALEAVLALWDPWDITQALRFLLPRLIEPTRTHLLQQALEAAPRHPLESVRATVLRFLAPELTGALLQQALEATLAFSKEDAKAEALSALAPQLTGTLLQQALEATLAFSEKRNRIDTLSALAPQLPEPARTHLLQQALEWTNILSKEEDQAWALVELAPQLTGALLQQALKTALAFSDKERVGRVLRSLTPQLTGPLLQQALETTLALSDEEARAQALTALAPQLTGTLLQQALQATLALSDEGVRTQALVALAPSLMGTPLQEDLETALALLDGAYLTYALCAIVPRLTGPLLKKALETTCNLQNEFKRAQKLTALAPLMTGTLLQQALVLLPYLAIRRSRGDTLLHTWARSSAGSGRPVPDSTCGGARWTTPVVRKRHAQARAGLLLATVALLALSGPPAPLFFPALARWSTSQAWASMDKVICRYQLGQWRTAY
jgi:hypothetical protein